MEIWFTRIDPKHHRFRVARPGFDPIDATLETRSMLLHDFAHYAVESALEINFGFYGLLAAGASLTELRDPDHLVPGQMEALLGIEQRVALLQTRFKRGDESEASPEWSVLRAVHGAWSKTRQGEALRLRWPGAPPQVVPDPGVMG
jgi:hypothetical protein